MPIKYYPAVKQFEDLSNKEVSDLFKPSGEADYWVATHLELFWRIYHWNWFNVYTGEESFWLFVKHGFREWRV